MALIRWSYLSNTFVGILQKQLHLQKVHSQYTLVIKSHETQIKEH